MEMETGMETGMGETQRMETGMETGMGETQRMETAGTRRHASPPPRRARRAHRIGAVGPRRWYPCKMRPSRRGSMRPDWRGDERLSRRGSITPAHASRPAGSTKLTRYTVSVHKTPPTRA
jgi:hypothetical protein